MKISAVWLTLATVAAALLLPASSEEPTECDRMENYDEVVTISSEQPYTVKKIKWCMKIPPRCTEDKTEFRTVLKNVTVNKTRVIKQCCKGHMRLDGNCVEICDQSQCPHVVCTADYQRCWCHPGFTGLLCQSKCNPGTWGDGCLNLCNGTCNGNCDHKDGHCRLETELKPSVNTTTNVTVNNDEPFFSTVVSSSNVVDGNETSTPTMTTTTTTTVTTLTTNASSTAAKDAPATTKPTNGSQGGYYRDLFMSVTNAKATVYKYTTYDHNDLIKKLIWISSLTVAALAIVFVIILVVFFKCVAPPPMSTTCSKQEPSTSVDTKNDAYKISFSMNTLSDRYTKPPCNSGMKEAMPVPPEAFCPVFKTPYYTTGGCDLYDYPQPIYEVL